MNFVQTYSHFVPLNAYKVALLFKRQKITMENQHPLLPSILHSTVKLSDMSSGEIEEFLGHKNVSFKVYLKLFAWESRLLWLLSGAVITVLIFNYMLGFVTLVFVGHLGSLELAGASIASVGIQGLAYGVMV